jgi:hypothetical protein
MKKIVILIATIFTFTGSVSAQNSPTDLRSKCMFGLKAGLNRSNVYDSEGEEFKAEPKSGLAAGVFVAIPIGRFLGIQPEALLSQRGFKATGRILGASYNLKRTSTYLDFPLLFALKPSEFITVVAGPQFSYLLNQTDSFTNATTTIEQETEFENDNVRKNALCFTAGLDITMKHLVLGVRAGWDVLNNNGDGTSSTPRYKNMWYQATIGYRFFKS